jgi:hypothetical protein
MIARVVLREFAKNSRFLPRLRPAQIARHKFFSLVDQLLRTPLAFDMQMTTLTKGIRSTP